MTNINYPARQQGTTISKKLRYADFEEVRTVVARLQERGLFRHASPVDVDELGSFVVITYLDPTVVAARQAARPTSSDPVRTPSRQLAIQQRQVPISKPVHKQWWFAPSVVLGALTVLCGLGYVVAQQLSKISAPNLGAGIVGFLFVVVLIVAIVKRISRGGGASSGRHGFHYGPCD